MDMKRTKNRKWQYNFDFDTNSRTFFTITTDHYIAELSGGSVRVSDRTTKKLLFRKSGFNYLYTADISPDEKTLAALENVKHFYVFSLKSFSQCRRITLPRGYESIDGYPCFSPCGNEILIPVSRYESRDPGYRYYICRYDASTYQMLSMTEIDYDSFPAWPIALQTN